MQRRCCFNFSARLIRVLWSRRFSRGRGSVFRPHTCASVIDTLLVCRVSDGLCRIYLATTAKDWIFFFPLRAIRKERKRNSPLPSVCVCDVSCIAFSNLFHLDDELLNLYNQPNGCSCENILLLIYYWRKFSKESFHPSPLVIIMSRLYKICS